MPVIESPRVGGSQPLHGSGKIRMAGPEQNMIMVVHQNIGEYIDVKAFRHFTHAFHKGCSIFIIPEYVLLFISP
jgi:hypothetical protein